MADSTPDELDIFMSALQARWGTVEGVGATPEHPPEGIGDPPMVVSYFVRGDVRPAPFIVHTVHSDLILARNTLHEDEEAARPFILRGIEAIAADIYMMKDSARTCEHCIVLDYIGPGPIRWQGTEYFGVRFVLEVKIQHANVSFF